MMMSMFPMLMILGGGGGNDLLDYFPSKVYWEIHAVPYQADAMLAQLKGAKPVGDVSGLIRDLDADKFTAREAAHQKLLALGAGVIPLIEPLIKSDSPEVAARAKEIVRILSQRAGSRDVHRLMAIRTLGEMKHAAALPALTKLTQSRELFVADYARHAVAAIKGEKYARATLSQQQRDEDIWLLPKNVGVVGQTTLTQGGGTIELEKLVAMMAQAGQGQVTREQIVEEFYKKGVLELVKKVGNLRLHSATVGVSDDIGGPGRSGYVVVVGRGRYDAEKVKATLREMCAKRKDGIKKVGDIELFSPDRDVAFLFPSNTRAVMLAAPTRESLPIDAMIAAVKAGRGTLADNQEIAALIRSADTKAPLWAVSKLSDAYRKEKMLAAFDSAVLIGKEADGVSTFTVTATVKDPAKLPASMKIFTDGLAQMKEQMKRTVARMPAMQPMADFVTGIKIKQDPNRVTITAQLQSASPMPMMLMPWMFAVGAADVRVEAVKARAVEVKVAPVPRKAVRINVRPRPATRPAPPRRTPIPRVPVKP